MVVFKKTEVIGIDLLSNFSRTMILKTDQFAIAALMKLETFTAE
jgi:hypothetical protein